ncbi:MAG: hypothetical protein JOZ39_00280, partial [Chloroflexi bacterium]|nr:hypothetical protein [Chloroflexota bacterium]
MKAIILRTMLLGLLTLPLAACTPADGVRAVRQANDTINQAEHNLGQQIIQAIASRLPDSIAQALDSAAGTAADPATEAAIKAVIQKGNSEQEQAIQRHDSSPMKDTSTDSYYQDAAQNNADMLNSGVTAIKLVSIEWGPITVNGTTAHATTYETWSSTYDDGSTDQSRDKNVYTLVQQNGSWKVDADDQPENDNGSGSSPASAQPSPSSIVQPNPSGGQGNGGGRGRSSASSVPSSASGGAAPSGGPLTISAQPGSPEAAVQQVILKGNQEQEQAIQKRDSTVLKDTSTDAYYQDLAQTNQDMVNNGVTAIKLVKIEWGPVSVNGSSATATTFETWWTQYSDGSTDQSRDRNAYSLVQQNGAWKVQSDDHPDDGFTTTPGGSQPGASQPGGTGTTSPQPSAPVPPASVAPRGRGTSSNWAGYAANSGSFTAVSGTWTVPQISNGSTQVGADAAWVGIGGERSRDLIQAGTEETVTSSGRTRYDAWIEMLPQYSHPVPLGVHPGDSVTVTIKQQQGDNWLVSFKNNTTGATYEKPETYQSSL